MKLVREAAEAGFTVGICASDSAEALPSLLSFLGSESYGDFDLRNIVVVASGCTPSILARVENIAASNRKISLMVEPRRYGKAEAINRILKTCPGDFVVMLNADATPEPGAIRRLLSAISSDSSIGAVSAMPVIETKSGLSSLLVDMIWSTHNESSRMLNHLNISNHACEELAVFRLSSIGMLPRDLVNDGAFFALTARSRGYSIRFNESARVRIETPARVSDLIAQRRRILFGHAQAWRKSGSPPKTIESLLLLSPSIGLRLVVKILARSPRFLLILPLAFVTEVSAALLSIQDTVMATKKHVVWRRVT